MYETDLAFCATCTCSYEMGQLPAENYTECMKRTQAKSHDSKRLWVSLITGLLITGLDWTGIQKFVFTHFEDY